MELAQIRGSSCDARDLKFVLKIHAPRNALEVSSKHQGRGFRFEVCLSPQDTASTTARIACFMSEAFKVFDCTREPISQPRLPAKKQSQLLAGLFPIVPAAVSRAPAHGMTGGVLGGASAAEFTSAHGSSSEVSPACNMAGHRGYGADVAHADLRRDHAAAVSNNKLVDPVSALLNHDARIFHSGGPDDFSKSGPSAKRRCSTSDSWSSGHPGEGRRSDDVEAARGSAQRDRRDG